MAEYIEREAAIKVLRGKAIAKYPASFCMGLFAASNELGDIPSADVAPVRHGRWDRVIPSKSAAKWSSKVSCSVCHNAGYNHFNYCPNCGAKMDGGDDNG